MLNEIENRVTVLVGIMATIFLFSGSLAQAEESSKPTTQNAKPTKVVKAKKPASAKQPPAGKDSCERGGKHWASGASCRTTCNDKNTVCDMRICAKGEWKNFGSCFGSSAVSPNCPAECGS